MCTPPPCYLPRAVAPFEAQTDRCLPHAGSWCTLLCACDNILGNEITNLEAPRNIGSEGMAQTRDGWFRLIQHLKHIMTRTRPLLHLGVRSSHRRVDSKLFYTGHVNIPYQVNLVRVGALRMRQDHPVSAFQARTHSFNTAWKAPS